jgi:cysteine desulfurase/selenocysteine lyase
VNRSASIASLVLDEKARQDAFPICRRKIFLAHAAVTALPRAVADAVVDYTQQSSENPQEFGEVLEDVERTRSVAANFIGSEPEEIALLGPTSLGLSLFANGWPWQQGDEVLCYADDYPANVYPWIELRRRGVSVRYLEPERKGEITPDLIERSLSTKTRMVALASCSFLTGFKIDVDEIGRRLHSRDVLFSLDAIQTLGAAPLSVEHVDFLSADAHKWLLGPLAIGIVYVKRKHFDRLRPTLLGAWNVISPNFIARDTIEFPNTARRYEPGVLNVAGIYGMKAGMELLSSVGLENIAARLLELRRELVQALSPSGFTAIAPDEENNTSGIVTFSHPDADLAAVFRHLEKNDVIASLRYDRTRTSLLRFSPHFYNTSAEIARVQTLVEQALTDRA